MPILEDILKYDYAPLKQIAVIVMHRLYDDTEGESMISSYWGGRDETLILV
jgi:hypothetical protein